MTTETKQCLECGDKLMGRADKKFCGDQCRNAYNNRNNSDANNLVRNINNTLRKNRRILGDLNTHGKTKVKRDKLLQAGFNFNYFTHVYETKTGSTYMFCYDLGYLPLEGEEILIVQREQ